MGNFNEICAAPADAWKTQDGAEEPKAAMTRRAVGSVAIQLTLGMIISLMGKNMKNVNNFLLNWYTIVGAATLVGVCGFALLVHKHWRMETTTSYILFGLFTLSLGTGIGAFMANQEYFHLTMMLFMSAVIGVDCLWFMLYKNRQEKTVQRSMVLGTILGLLCVMLCVCFVEYQTKGEGQYEGATLLALCMGICFVVCFYITFDIVAIAIPECEDAEDYIYAALHIYIDIFKALYLMIVAGVLAILG